MAMICILFVYWPENCLPMASTLYAITLYILSAGTHTNCSSHVLTDSEHKSMQFHAMPCNAMQSQWTGHQALPYRQTRTHGTIPSLLSIA